MNGAAGNAFRRDALAGRPRRCLSEGGRGNPDVFLVETETGPIVVKDFAPRSAFVRRLFGRRLLAREARVYRRLAGLPAVPRLLGTVDADAIALEYRPGVLLSRSLRGRLPEGFLEALQETIAAMHGRGIVHLDLRHRSNVLAGEDGRPVVLDFASALVFDPESRWGRGAVALLGWFDRRALAKWRAKLGQAGSPLGGVGSSAGSRGASRPM